MRELEAGTSHTHTHKRKRESKRERERPTSEREGGGEEVDQRKKEREREGGGGGPRLARDAVACPVVEVLVRNHALDTCVIRVRRRLRRAQDQPTRVMRFTRYHREPSLFMTILYFSLYLLCSFWRLP